MKDCKNRVLSQVKYRGGYSGGVPPLPIPNREVKPARADGTAPPGGRVGRRRPSGSPSEKQETAYPAGSLLFIPARLKILVEDPDGGAIANLLQHKTSEADFRTVARLQIRRYKAAPPDGHIIHEQALFACEGCLWPQAAS